MSILSKLLNTDNALPYNCYELGHTWTPSCTEAALGLALSALKDSFRMYSLLYLATQLLFRGRMTSGDFIKCIQSATRSTFFLSFNGFITLIAFCGFSNLIGRLYLPLVGHFPAAVASYFSLIIESPARRSALAFYCANIAAETFLFGRWNRLLNEAQIANRFARLSANQKAAYSPQDQALYQMINQNAKLDPTTNWVNHELNAVSNCLDTSINNGGQQTMTVKSNSNFLHSLMMIMYNSKLGNWQPEHVIELSMFISGMAGLTYLYNRQSFPKCWQFKQINQINSSNDHIESNADDSEHYCSSDHQCDLCSFRTKRHQDLIMSALNFLLGDFRSKEADHGCCALKSKSRHSRSKELKSNSNDAAHPQQQGIWKQGWRRTVDMFKSLVAQSHRTSNDCLNASTASTCVRSMCSGSLRGFCIGYSLQATLNLAMQLKQLASGRPADWWSLLNAEHMQMGCQAAIFVGTYRLSSCWMHRHQQSYQHAHSVLATCIGAVMARIAVPHVNLNLTQYIFWKSMENWFWHHADQREAQRKLAIKQYEQWLERCVAFINSESVSKKDVDQSINAKTSAIKCIDKLDLNAQMAAQKQSVDQQHHQPHAENNAVDDDYIDLKNKLTSIDDPLASCGASPNDTNVKYANESTKKPIISILCDSAGNKPKWVLNMIDKMANKHVQKHYGPSIFDYFSSDTLLRTIYAVSVAQLFYVEVLFPLNLRASYNRFLNKVTQNRFQLMNRNIIDHFGVPSSNGMPLYMPELDPQHLSRHFMEHVFVWML